MTCERKKKTGLFDFAADFGGGGIHSSETAVVEVEPCMNGRPVRQPKPNKKFDDYEMEEIEEGGERITVVRPEAPKVGSSFVLHVGECEEEFKYWIPRCVADLHLDSHRKS